MTRIVLSAPLADAIARRGRPLEIYGRTLKCTEEEIVLLSDLRQAKMILAALWATAWEDSEHNSTRRAAARRHRELKPWIS